MPLPADFTELRARYVEDGAVCVRRVLEPDSAAALLEHLDVLIGDAAERWTTNRVGGFSDRHLWPTHPWMRELCTASALPELAGRMMQSSSARLFFDHTFVRDAGTAHRTPWHQDRPYWPFQGTQIVSIWLALTPCGPDSSGLRFIKGSHGWHKTFRPTPFGDASASAKFLDENAELEEMPDFDAEPERWEYLEWDMQPGDAIVFSGEAVHGSRENAASDQRRAAVSVRYLGDDARWDPRPGTDPIVTAEQVSIRPGDPPHDDAYFPLVWRDSP